MKKLLSMVLALVLALAVFGMPASAEVPSGQYVNGVWRYDELVEVDIIAAYWAEHTDTPEEKWIYGWVKDNMNIQINVIGAVPYNAIGEQTSLLFAAGDLPDGLMGFHNLSGNNSVTYGDQAGQLLPLDTLITEDNMPALWQLLQEEPVMQLIGTPAGHFYVMPEFFEDPIVYPAVSYTPQTYNKTWFEAVGYEDIPTDVDELIEALIAIKEQNPGNVEGEWAPYGGTGNGALLPIYRAYGFYEWQDTPINFFGADYLNGGEMVMAALHDNYYEYIKTVRTMYEEGLLEQDLYTLDDAQVAARAMEQRYALVPTWGINGTVGENWAKWYYAPPFTSSYDETPHVTVAKPVGTSALLSICAGADDAAIDALLRVADLNYNNETKYICIYGPQEGDPLYNLSAPVWYWQEQPEGFVRNALLFADYAASEFTGWADLLQEVSFMTWSGSPASRRAPDPRWHDYDIDSELERGAGSYKAAYGPYATVDYPGPSLEGEVKARYADLNTTIANHIATETAKFITGVRELNDGEWEAFKTELLDLGYEELYDISYDYFVERYGE